MWFAAPFGEQCCCGRAGGRKEGLSFFVRRLCVAIAGGGVHDEGYLDEKFNQLEELQDDRHPNFAEVVANLFFKDSVDLIAHVAQALEKNPPDFLKIDRLMCHLNSSTSGIGAVKMKNEVSKFRGYCKQGNIEGCLISLKRLKMENDLLKQKLVNYFQMLRAVTRVEMAVRPL